MNRQKEQDGCAILGAFGILACCFLGFVFAFIVTIKLSWYLF